MTIAAGQSREASVLAIIWLFFLVRGIFYCSFLPMWEGYDEWAHFAYVEEVAQSGPALVDRRGPVSREVAASLTYVPVPWELRVLAPPASTEDTYWRLSEQDRVSLQKKLNAVPERWMREKSTSGPLIYEALQPPLYYWLLAGPDQLAKYRPLADRVFVLRCLSLLIAAFSIPLVFLVVRRVTHRSILALQTCAVLALMPELMIDVCRVGNECLGILLFSWLTLISLDLMEEHTPRRTGLKAGIALGLGLLTKAYFLTAVPALASIYLWRLYRTRQRIALLSHASKTYGLASLIAGWWYLHNRLTTGTWSGLNESVMLVHDTAKQFFLGALTLPWARGIDSILVSHIWFGGWSSLGLRSWMYHVLFSIVGLGVCGVACVLWRSKNAIESPLLAVTIIYGWFWLGQLYNALLLFLSKGVATSMGWYMYCVVAAELTLLIVGLYALTPARRWVWTYGALVTIIAAMDLYSVHFISIPYYTGLIAHQENGSIGSFHLSQLNRVGISEIVGRLVMNKCTWITGVTLRVSWLLYVVTTVSLATLGNLIAPSSGSGLRWRVYRAVRLI